jgi:predicted murein hydrolase (TIGR00659 family)
MNRVGDLWVYLSASPLLWLTLTLGAYAFADMIARRFGRHPLANPVLIAVALLAVVLLSTGTDHRTFFEGAQFVHFLLGPATVALAVPLYENRARVRRALLPIAGSLVAGSLVAVASAVGIAWALGAPSALLVAIAPKSVTAGIAMGISQELGGEPSLTAALVILTGICGAVMVTPLMNLIRIRDFRARGFAAGLAAHGIGTARAFQVDGLAGTFAGIAMGLNALLTAFLVPFVLRFWGL